MSQHLQSTLPKFDVFAQPPARTMPMVGRPPKGAAGVGLSPVVAMISPAAAATQIASGRRPVGQTDVGGGMLGDYLVGVALLAVAGFASYQAGKAMAPSGQETTWAWVGVPVGVLFGTVGLGVMGFVSNRKS